MILPFRIKLKEKNAYVHLCSIPEVAKQVICIYYSYSYSYISYSYCNKLYRSRSFPWGWQKVTLKAKTSENTVESTITQKNLQEPFTANHPGHQETTFSHSCWESLLAELHKVKFGKLQLPRRWVDLFTNTFRDLHQYCNLNFTQHCVYVKGDKLMTAYLNFTQHCAYVKGDRLMTAYEQRMSTSLHLWAIFRHENEGKL